MFWLKKIVVLFAFIDSFPYIRHRGSAQMNDVR